MVNLTLVVLIQTTCGIAGSFITVFELKTEKQQEELAL